MNDPLAFISSVTWTFASTMPWAPHEYIVRHRVDRQGFDELALHIRLHGRLGRWGSKLHWYWTLDDWKYWSMGWPLHETIIINRARVSADDTRYLIDGNLIAADREILDTWCDFTECPACLSREGITAEWEALDLLGYESRLVGLVCPACGHRML